MFRREAKPFSLCLCGKSGYVRSKPVLGDGVPMDKKLLRKKSRGRRKNQCANFMYPVFIITFAYEEFFEGYAMRRSIMQ